MEKNDNENIKIKDISKEEKQKNDKKGHRERIRKKFLERGIKSLSNYELLEFLLFYCNTQKDTKSVAKNILKALYNYALKYEIVDKDYSKFIELVKRERVIKRTIFTEKEREIVFASDNKICKAICVLIYTGLRIEEFLNLKKENIENNFIFVENSKTNAGVRAIPIHSKIKNIVDIFLRDEGEYLFCWKNRKNKTVYETFRRSFKELMLELEMEHTIHDTRHTFASMMNKVGANDVALTTMIGHTDVNLTKSIYTHKELEDLEETMKLLS